MAKKKDDEYIEGMPGKKSDDTPGLARKIIDEVTDKVGDYENNMSSVLSQVEEWGDMFRVKLPAQRNKKAFSNPRLTEFFRAVNTVGTMAYRMLTAQDPFFELRPMSLLNYEGQLLRVQATLETQLRESRYKQNLLTACMGVAAFGTQFVEERYEVIGINSFGRRIPATTFKPRSLLQVAFERGTIDIEDADWVSTSDLVSEAALMDIAADSKATGQNWQQRVIEASIKDESSITEMSPFLEARYAANRYAQQNGKLGRKELLIYNGKLDCLNDNVEYCVGLVNRKYLVKFYPNKNQHGKRDLRVAYWVKDPLSLDPLGLGLGTVAGKLHKSMDANRQRAQDGIAMASYNMWLRRRDGGINDDQMKIRPLQTIDADIDGALKPLITNLQAPDAALKLEEILRQEFMAATGATPTLQGMLTDVSATESTLSQNEALRNISVKTELIAESFVREHLNICHSNNVAYLKEPINVNQAGFAGRVYPSDLKVDVDFEIKTVTDKDYKPQRLNQLREVLQMVLSTKSAHPSLAAMDVVPVIKAILKGLDVNPEEVFPNGSEPDPMMLQAMMAARGGAPGMVQPGAPAAPASTDVLSTPLGPVQGSA